MTADDIRALEEAFSGAWPPAETQMLNGWRLRFTNGVSRRANSVFPLDWNGQDAGRDIETVEDAYRAKGLRPAFYLPPNGQPAGLDDLLAARGYGAEGHVHVQNLNLSDRCLPARRDMEFTQRCEMTRQWTGTYLQGSSNPKDLAARASIMARAAGDRAYILAGSEADVLGCGMAVRAGDWALVQGMRTVAGHQRQGVGMAILDRLLSWAVEQGVKQAALQVEKDNPAALRLYEKAGFTTVYDYHYRISGPGP